MKKVNSTLAIVATIYSILVLPALLYGIGTIIAFDPNPMHWSLVTTITGRVFLVLMLIVWANHSIGQFKWLLLELNRISNER